MIYYWGLIGVTIFVVVNQLGMELKMPDLSGSDAPQQILQSAYTISYAWQRTSTLFGLQLFMLVLKSLQFLQYIKRFSLIGTTLTYAAGDIFVFFVVMAFVIAAPPSTTSRSARTCASSRRSAHGVPVLLGLATLWDPSWYYEKDPVSSIILMLLFTCLCMGRHDDHHRDHHRGLPQKAEAAARLCLRAGEAAVARSCWRGSTTTPTDAAAQGTAAAALGWTHVRRFVSKVPAAAAPATAAARPPPTARRPTAGASAAWGKAVDSIAPPPPDGAAGGARPPAPRAAAPRAAACGARRTEHADRG